MMVFFLFGSIIRTMMGKSSETTATEGDMEDRISSLPRNVIDLILDRVPIRDAARASLLSSKWRDVLAEYPHLRFNQQFSNSIARNRLPSEFNNDYVHIVNRILLQHFGPILKFVLDLPELHPMRLSDVDQWMLFLSRKGVRELTLDNSSSSPYKLPAYIFSFSELTYLKTSRCIFRPPTTFEGFGKLNRLILVEVTFGSSVLNVPQLVILILRNCSGVHHLNVSAPQLQKLTLYENDYLALDNYMICKKLAYVYLALPNGIQQHRQGERISLQELFGCWNTLTNAYLDGRFLKHLAAGIIPERLPTTMDCLRQLMLFRISFDLDQTACILCLLQSSLCLQKFEIWIESVADNDVTVLNYLEEPSRMNQTIDGLQTVKIRYFKGSKPEVLFIKLLLACSPSLEKIYIEEDEKLRLNERLRIAKELMRFSRASTKAEMMFQPLNSAST
ncbi:F-box/FBD/LRR-repeat protein At1g13570-like isoform X1 [Coffea eugenioides]|uniref:F-box/FBD/LRR-repeat protein At1g13570-like isoform X1 n=2 Tax=Coffea eugenioides TaxID=49369 RepID=UPI000F60FC03|nr:F-box/FBD/LRR-repeat protein At1g13570-like isoform X1 [Coffea eugenioides]